MMRMATAAGALAAGMLQLAGHAVAQPDERGVLQGDWRTHAQVQVQHAAARLVVIAEPRSNVSVSVQHGPSRLPPPSVRLEGGRVVVDGGLDHGLGGEHIDCRGGVNRGPFGASDQRAVVVGGYGRIAYADLPVVTARVPLDARVAGQGAVYGQVNGPTRSLSVASSGCGDWTAGPVQGRLEAAFSGSGDLHAADVGALKAAVTGSSDVTVGQVRGGAVNVDIAGSGDVHALSIAGPLQARVTGSGDLTVGRIDGPVHAELAGSGDVKLTGGHAPEIVARVAGSGDFTFGGDAGRVEAVAIGSGDIHIAHASGPVSRISTGSSDVEIGR